MIYLGGITKEIKMFFNNYAFAHKVMGLYGYIVNSHFYDILLNLYKISVESI